MTLGICLAAVLAHFVPGAFAALSYQRGAILAGQWWRLLTCHLTHGSTSHLVWNIGAFLVLGTMSGPRLRRAYPFFLAGSALAVGLGLLIALPELDWYCGLSGVDVALFSYLLAGQWALSWHERDKLRMCLNGLWTAGFAGKIAYEFSCGRMFFVRTQDLPPVPLAHLLGFLAGIAAFIIESGLRTPAEKLPKEA